MAGHIPIQINSFDQADIYGRTSSLRI